MELVPLTPELNPTAGPKVRILNKEGHKDLKEVILVLLSPRILQKIRPFDPMSGLNTTFFEISVISCSKICLRDLLYDLFR